MLSLLFIIFIGLIVWFVITYNSLRAQSERVKGFASNILAATRKRLDLAKRIQDVAAGYADHEKLVQLSAAENMRNIGNAQSAEERVGQVMGQVNALAMAYPQLKADNTYSQLMTQWHQLEDDIHMSRENYNGAVTQYNAYQGALPQVLIASKVGFPAAPYYHTETDGLDVLPEFKTDDGAKVKESLSRLADATKTNAAKAKAKLDEATTKYADSKSKLDKDMNEPPSSDS